MQYTENGPTTRSNGRLLCGFHKRLRNPAPTTPEVGLPCRQNGQGCSQVVHYRRRFGDHAGRLNDPLARDNPNNKG